MRGATRGGVGLARVLLGRSRRLDLAHPRDGCPLDFEERLHDVIRERGCPVVLVLEGFRISDDPAARSVFEVRLA